MDIKNFYNHIKMCLNVVTRLREYLLPGYQSIKIQSQFEEYFIPDFDHPPILGLFRFTLTLETHYLWQLLMTLV